VRLQVEREHWETRQSPTLVSAIRGALCLKQQADTQDERQEASLSLYTLVTWHNMYANIYFLYQHYSTEEAMGCISNQHHLQEARLTFTLSGNTSNTDSGRKRPLMPGLSTC